MLSASNNNNIDGKRDLTSDLNSVTNNTPWPLFNLAVKLNNDIISAIHACLICNC